MNEDELIKELEKFRKKEIFYREIIENSGIISIVDSTGTYVDINQASADFLGKSKAEIIGKKISDLHPKKDAKKYMDRVEFVLQTGQEHKYEDKIQNKWILTRKYPIKINGDILVQINSLDVSDEKLAEKREEYQKTVLEVIVQGTSELITLLDSNGKIIFQNDIHEKLLGYEFDNIKDKHFSEFIHPDDLGNLEKNLDSGIKGDIQHVTFEYRALSLDDSYLNFFATANTIHSATGERQFVIVSKDMTDYLKMLEVVQDTSVLKKTTKIIYDFLDDSLNQSLSPISTYLQRALHFKDTDKKNELIFNSLKNIQKLSGLNHSFQRIIQNYFSQQDVQDNVSSSLGDALEQILNNEKIKLWTGEDFEPDPNTKFKVRYNGLKSGLVKIPHTRIDEYGLNLIVNELCINAVDAISFKQKKEGTVNIYVKHTEKYVNLIIRDDGIGMTKRENQIHYGPFVKIEGKSKPRRMGFGISIVRQIVEKYGGSITTRSREYKGTTVELKLPLA
jgi:two-component system, sporulation sensor kinase A